MTDLGTLTREFCKRHFGGLKAACEAANLKYSTLHSQIVNGRDIPFASIERLCNAAGVSLEAFRARRAEIGVLAPNPSAALHRRAAAAYSQAMRDVQADMLRQGSDIMVDDVLNWLNRNNGKLTDFDALRERVDLFRVATPDDRLMKAARIGHNSLAAHYFNIGDTAEYEKKASQLHPSFISSILAAHIEVHKTQQYQISDISFTATIDGFEIEENYRRVIAPVETLDGEKLTLVFAKII